MSKKRQGKQSAESGATRVQQSMGSNSKRKDSEDLQQDRQSTIANGYPTPFTDNKRKREDENGEQLAPKSKRSKSESSPEETQIEASVMKTRRKGRKPMKAELEDEDGSRETSRESWVISGGVGGRMLPIDPIFSHDEK